MSSTLNRPITRRTLGQVAAAATCVMASGQARSALTEGSTAELSRDGEREPGVQLLLDWQFGKRLLSIEELTLGADWQLYANPSEAIALAIPPE